MLRGLYSWAAESVQQSMHFTALLGGRKKPEIFVEPTRRNVSVLAGLLHLYEGVRQVA